MRVVIVGAAGQLGTDCCRAFGEAGHEVIPVSHAELEITCGATVQRVLEDMRPELVVNTAAMHDVEACEATPERAFEVNGVGARNLALACDRLGSVLMHVSTDYVFDGAKYAPYSEDDLPRPLNVYGNTKLSGEHFVSTLAPRSFVVRTSGLYGRAACRAKGGGLNFVRLMLKLGRERGEVKVVADEFVTPTYTLDLARQLVALASSDLYGVVHATCQGACSWYEFAEAIFALAALPVRMRVADPSDFPAKVPRPKYSVLENHRLQTAGVDRMPDWQTSLRSYLEELEEVHPASAVPAMRP